MSIKIEKIQLVRVQSSTISAVGYSGNANGVGTLLVSFVSGGLYAYKNVPQAVAEGFFTASIRTSDSGIVGLGKKSVGRYFHAQVKGIYDFEKIEVVA